MQRSKYLVLLASLSAQELRLYHKFLHSPFFTYSEPVRSLFAYLRRYHPEFASPRLERRVVFKKLFPARTYSEHTLRNLLHESTSLLEEFLVQLQLQQCPSLQKRLQAQAYGQRDLYPYFERLTRSLLSEIDQQDQKDITSYYEQFKLSEQYYFHPSTDKLKEGGPALLAMHDNLDLYFMANKLRLSNEAGARSRVVKQEMPLRFVPEVLAHLGDFAQHHPILPTYALLYQLNKSGDESIFQALKHQLFTMPERLSADDQQVVLLHLLNYAIRRGNTGESDFLREAFILYQWGLEHKLLMENEQLTDMTFTNVAVLGCKINALDEVAEFIEEYAGYLDPTAREPAVTLAQAYLHYHRKEYEQVDELLGNYNFDSLMYQFRVRPILIRALFEWFREEESYYDLLHARMDAFEKYLRRHRRLSEQKSVPYLGFLKFLRKLSKMILQRSLSPKERKKWKKRVREHPTVINKEWLLDQI